MLIIQELLPPPLMIRTHKEVAAALEYLQSKPTIAYDTETTGLSRQKDYALFLALSDGKKRYCVGPEHIQEFKPLMEDPEKTWIAHNANFDAWMLYNIGIDIRKSGSRYDTAVMHLLHDDIASHALDYLAEHLLKIMKRSFKSEFPEVKRGEKIGDVLMSVWDNDPLRVTHYASLDAYVTMRVYNVLRKILRKTTIADKGDLLNYYETYELPFTDVLLDIEMAGVQMDRESLITEKVNAEEKLSVIKKWFFKRLGKVCGATGKHISEHMFDTLKLPPLKKTKGGSKALDADTLKFWGKNRSLSQEQREAANALLEWRKLEKQVGTYLENLDVYSKQDGRVHTTFNQHIVKSGRLSSSAPNLQNQPPGVRHLFTHGPGRILFGGDYGQLEWRLAADMSRDKKMLEDVLAGRDAHSSTAASLFNLDYALVDAAHNTESPTTEDKELKKYRSFAKTLNFGVLYGEGPNKISESLEIPIQEAQKFLRNFQQTYPGLYTYFHKVFKFAREHGYCYTLLGRPRSLPNINSDDFRIRAQEERYAKNSPIQGSASDIMKAGMLKLARLSYFKSGDAKMVLQIHDELIIDADAKLIGDEDFKRNVEWNLLTPLGPDALRVPLSLDLKSGRTWADIK